MPNELKDLLLADYHTRVDAMGKSEESGERRVNLFIGLIAVVGSAAGALVSKGPDALSVYGRWFAVAALSALLLVGLVTLM